MRLLILFVISVTSVVAQPLPQTFTPAKSAADAGFSADRLKRLDTWLQGLIDQGIAPNAVTFVAHKGKVVHYKAFGYRNLAKKTPLQRDDLYRIASQSKAITTTTLMTLFEEEKFLLDDPISKYIPAFKNPTVLVRYDKKDPVGGTYETRPAKSEITIRQLLSHNAGIPYEHPLDGRPEFKVPFFNSMAPDKLEDAINKLAKRPLLRDPGTDSTGAGFTYGLNTDILGRLVEVLSGKPLDVAMRERVLEPLGMTDTYFYLPDSKASRLVELYEKSSMDKPLTLHTNEAYRNSSISGAKTYFSGGAGLISSVEDYAKLCQMLLNGGTFNNKRILGRKTVEMMLRNQIGAAEVWDRKDKFGLGFQLITENSHYGDQATPGSFTWGGMYCSEFTIDPKEELILLIFTNVQPYAYYSDFVKKFRIAVYQALD
ncbi:MULTISPECIES: serine hydrolase [unclassified Spirosoma]|uniref:serine hydrolase domain-containing protein n=1 Tax=unclassified Spirosoma TaxID=2621999 RepID=UPI00095C2102|nr:MULTISPECIES: serine hydrolase domain-containing protein [unclassified Spirosoma]MBN8826297.1 beta-lactamase family protein [Spirosoma sp.]OJW75196.1 MAG: serine hydrolase [Spirosoma sp. 48-14]